MGKPTISLVFKGVQKITNEFRKWDRRLEGRRGTLRIIGQYVAEISKQSFTKQADPETGSPWVPLAPSTVREKARKGLSKKALIRTGQMKNSIGYAITGSDRVMIGPADGKGKWHQEGTVSGAGGSAASRRSGGGQVGVPARPFLGLGPANELKIKAIATKWIQGRRI